MRLLNIANQINKMKGRDLPSLQTFKTIFEALPASARAGLLRSYWFLGGPEMPGHAQDYFLGLVEEALIKSHLATRRRPRKGGRR